jgi:hypothetical protein
VRSRRKRYRKTQSARASTNSPRSRTFRHSRRSCA